MFTNAASSAKTTGAQKISRGEGEPYYSVSVHKTRFEKYEELMTELFGPGDILRGSSTQRKPRPKKVSTRLIFHIARFSNDDLNRSEVLAALRVSDAPMNTNAVGFETTSSRSSTPALIEEASVPFLVPSVPPHPATDSDVIRLHGQISSSCVRQHSRHLR